MKKLLVVALLALTASQAHAYLTTFGPDPSSKPDQEFKAALKSTASTYSDAITGTNELLSYSPANDGYTVTRVGLLASTIEGSAMIAGIGTKTVATGDTGYFLIQTKGYATVKYDASTPAGGILRGDRLCANAVGAAMKCTGAASHSKVIALEAKASGTGTDLKVLVNAQ